VSVSVLLASVVVLARGVGRLAAGRALEPDDLVVLVCRGPAVPRAESAFLAVALLPEGAPPSSA
jgi:hypothetical protein